MDIVNQFRGEMVNSLMFIYVLFLIGMKIGIIPFILICFFGDYWRKKAFK